MRKPLNLAAVDLGAESGRVALATFSEGRVQIDEVHRFPNGPVRVLDSLFWDPLRLFTEIKHGLSLCAARGKIDGIGLDTWGVDFALLGKDGRLLGNPFHYRDTRTEGMMEKAFARMPREEIFAVTGIQFMVLNSLYQLLSMQDSPTLELAETFLTMPDLFNYWLSGVKACEFTNATTTQMYNPRTGNWAFDMISRLGLPTRILPAIVQPGMQLGPLLASVASETGLDRIQVITPACHDTGSAVAAVPAEVGHFTYISSGTWSLVGVETGQPVITPQSLAYNLTNEGGVGGTFRLLKNVTGLWLVQECRRIWSQAGESYTYSELAQMAASAEPFVSFVDPDDPGFLRPVDMPAALEAFCARTSQPIPETRGCLLRCIYESLALKYRQVIENLEVLLGHPLEVVHIIGGGSQNELLCQFTADATAKPVITGPVEATALGNALVQAMGLGYFASLAEARQCVRDSMELKTYLPINPDAWSLAYERFLRLLT